MYMLFDLLARRRRLIYRPSLLIANGQRNLIAHIKLSILSPSENQQINTQETEQYSLTVFPPSVNANKSSRDFSRATTCQIEHLSSFINVKVICIRV